MLRTAVALITVVSAVLASPASSTTASRPFAFAGVIEGSCGPTWTHTDRMAMVDWMGAHGLDTYVHAPKNDPYQRTQWRDPYPAADMADFAAEIAAARRAPGITSSSDANNARSAQVSFGLAPTCRCRTVTWLRSSRISADFQDSSRRDKHSHTNPRVTSR